MATLTYIVPVYNGAQTIKRTLSSIIDQPGFPEIIVVDDGSTDESAKLVATFGDRVTMFRQQNAGPSAARNLGLQAVRSPVVCFVDCDDFVVGPHCRAIEDTWTSDVDVIIGLAAEGNDNFCMLANRNKYDFRSTSDNLIRQFLRGNWVQTSTICWSTSFLRKIGAWDSSLFIGEDIELAIRGFLAHPRIVFSSQPAWIVYNHHSYSERQSQSPKYASGQLRSLSKLITLMEQANCDSATMELFFRDCVTLARTFYLNGFVDESFELFSIAWKRSYSSYPGPWFERALAGCMGVRLTLAARRSVGQMKRALLKRMGMQKNQRYGRQYGFWIDWVQSYDWRNCP